MRIEKRTIRRISWLVVWLIGVCLVLALSGCDGETETTPEATQPPEATEEATVPPPEELTATPTEEPTATPTEEPTATPTETVPSSYCGDGVCNVGVENTNLCEADCPCNDNGLCQEETGEAQPCRDCSPRAEDLCGVSCPLGSCEYEMACLIMPDTGPRCWDNVICGGGQGGQPTTQPPPGDPCASNYCGDRWCACGETWQTCPDDCLN